MAPPILEFDQAGTLLRRWGGEDGPGYSGRRRTTASTSTTRATSGSAATAAARRPHPEVHAGRQVRHAGREQDRASRPDSLSTDHFFLVAKTFFHAPTNEVFVADGYGNRRVAVIDADTGKMKRFWGAYGKPPDDKAAAAQGAYDPDGDLPALPRPGALRRGLERRPRLRLRPDQQPHPGLQGRRHLRPRGLHAARLARRRLGVGRRRSRATRSSGSSTSPTAATRRSASSTARA